MANSIIRTWEKEDFLNYSTKKVCIFVAKFFSKYLTKKNNSELTKFWDSIFSNVANKDNYTFTTTYLYKELNNPKLGLEIFEE